MQLTTCYLSGLLADAKEAHTRYEERFALEGVKPPVHNWEDWYARYIMQRIKDREYNELFAPVDVSCQLAPQLDIQEADENVPVLKDAWKLGL